jgi:hypothetical protein
MTKLHKLVFVGAFASSIALATGAYAQGGNHVQGWNTASQNQTVKVSNETNNNFWNFHHMMADWEDFFKHFHLNMPTIHHHHHHVGPPGGSVNPGGGDDQGENGNGQGDNNNDQ